MPDDGFCAYDEVLARLDKSQVKEILEALKKEYHVNDGGSCLLFSSEWHVNRPMSQARQGDYILYNRLLICILSYGSILYPYVVCAKFSKHL